MADPIKIDERREAIIPGDKEATIAFAAEHFLSLAEKMIQIQGYFAVALSGGSTPQAIFHKIAESEKRNQIDWSSVLLFWSDERAVPMDDPDSNYGMAMRSGFGSLPFKRENIFRMEAEKEIENAALNYEKKIREKIPNQVFDLVMLGMGEDGHVASLFPNTEGLQAVNRLVIANYIPQKETWRMSLTFEAINASHCTAIYVIGKNKAEIAAQALSEKGQKLPAFSIGTSTHKALWILDHDAAEHLGLRTY